MSHSTVLVIGEDPETQLAPFNENTDELEEQYKKFIDEEPEMRKEWKNNKKVDAWFPTGNQTRISKEVFAALKKLKVGKEMDIVVTDSFLENFKSGDKRAFIDMKDKKWVRLYAEIVTCFHGDERPWKWALRVKKVAAPKKIGVQEKYKTFETYVKDWHGYDKPDAETGKYGHWRNPKARWDWYFLGGRWQGYFMVKAGVEGKKGEASYGIDPSTNPSEADQARKCDIDWEGMKERDKKHAEEDWVKFQEDVAKKSPVELIWGRKADITKEEWIARACHPSTFAVLKDGVWYEKGEMVWFGCVADQKDQDKWEEEFDKLLKELPESTLLSVYDVHI